MQTVGSVTVASGTTTCDITWKSNYVWKNDGDTAYLYDGSGRLVSQKKVMIMNVTVDRLRETAVLLMHPEGNQQILFPRELLSGVEEGDILEITATRGSITRIVKEVGKSVSSIR